MQPDLLTKAGVALIFFLNGAGLSFAAMRAGALRWRLHGVVQACTFLVFPVIGFAAFFLLNRLAPGINDRAIRIKTASRRRATRSPR